MRLLADRHEPLLVALADDPHERAVERQVLAVEPERLADPQPGGVQQLEQRRVARTGRGGRVRAAGPPPRRQRVRQPPALAWQVEVRRDVDVDEPLAVGEPVEALERRRPAAQAGRGERRGPSARRPLGRASGRPGRRRRHRPSAPRPPARPARREVVEVGAIGADRGRRQAALDVEVGAGSRRSPGAGRLGTADQPSRPGHRPARRATPRPGRAARARRPASRRRPARRRASRPARRCGPRGPAARPRSRSGRRARAWRSGSGRRRGPRSAGRWVTHRTWWRRARPHRLRPIGSALRPPTPVSTSSNTRVGRGVGLGQDALDREGDARQLAARGDPGQRPGRLAGVRGEAIDDLVEPARVERDRVAVDLDRRLRRGRPTRRPTATSNTPAGNPSSTRTASTRRPGTSPPRVACRRQRRAGRRDLGQADARPRAWRRARSSSSPRSRSASAGRRLAVGDDRRLVVAVAPQQAVDDAEAGVQLGQRPRIVVDALGQACAPRRRRPPAPPRGRPAGRPAARSAGRAGPAPRASWRAVAATSRAPAAVRGQGLAQRGRPAGDRLAVLGRGQSGGDLVGLAGSQPRRGDLAGLVVEQVQPPRDLARVERRRVEQRPGSRASARPPSAIVAAQVLVAAPAVEQVALPALVEQATLVVLAVDLDERADLVGQARRGHRGVVEARGRAAGGVTSRTAMSGSGSAVEQRLDPRDVRAVADERRVGAGAERQPEGIDEQALAGPGLAGDDVQAGVERQAQPVDEGEVGDGQLEQATRPSRTAASVTTAGAPPCGGAGPRTAGRPCGSTRRIGRSRAWTSTTSPTEIGRSSRPSTETSAS